MASSNDDSPGSGAPRRRPQPPTLDLKATELTSPKGSDPSPPKPEARASAAARPNATTRTPDTPKPDTPKGASEAAETASTPAPAPGPSPAPADTPAATASKAPVQAKPSANAGSGRTGRVDEKAARTAADNAPARASGAAAKPDVPPRARPWHPVGLIVGAGAGAAAGALALLAASWFAGLPLGPDERVTATASRVQALEGRVGELAARPAPRPDPRIDEMAARLSALEQALAQTKAMENRLARLETAPPSAQGQADPELAGRIATLEKRVDEAVAAAGAARPSAEIEGLSQRIAALEQASKTLQAQLAQARAPEADRPARFAAASTALRSAVESGAPYAPELAAVRPFADPARLKTLEPFASEGLPSATALSRELTTLIASARPPAASAAVGEGLSWLERLQASAAKLVRIRRTDAPAGSDESLARVQAGAARGDLAAALAEAAKLPDAVRAPLEPWIRKVQARGAALASAQELAREGLNSLVGRGSEPGAR